MKHKPLIIYFIILITLCAGFIVGAKTLGEQGMYLAQGYMLTPALAALVTRMFFYEKKFTDANLRFGRLRDYGKFWLVSLGITALSYVFFTLCGAIRWDFTGQEFLMRLSAQFAAVGQDMEASLPPGFTPQTMLLIYFIGGLTVFNIIPGLITGFGEEFGHRGFMFPALDRVAQDVPQNSFCVLRGQDKSCRTWIALMIGGLIWYAWHLPLALVIPQTADIPLGELILNFIALGIGSLCAFIYLAYVYVTTRSVWITSLAHIVMNNSASAFSYFAVVQNQLLANIGLALTMIIAAFILYRKNALGVFAEYFHGGTDGSPP
ncbi:MAG: CPBP family intramembrane metalloprotease [Anaerolineales bacterium]|nr:CPBP family intramembrane metalloprotease [Anaerolineales bacterium]